MQTTGIPACWFGRWGDDASKEHLQPERRGRRCPFVGDAVHAVFHGREGVPEAPSDETE